MKRNTRVALAMLVVGIILLIHTFHNVRLNEDYYIIDTNNTRPNILFILADDLGNYANMSCKS